MLIAVTGLKREARIVRSPDVKVVIGGGHDLDKKLAAMFDPPLEGGSKADLHVSAKTASGRGVDAADGPLPEKSSLHSDFSTLPQGEGRNNVQGIISIGIAGGLAPDLKPGDCVIATEIIFGAERMLADMAWRRTLMQVLPFASVGAIAGSDGLVTSADAKASLHRATRARMVDMESHIVARIAQARKIPFAALRVVSDAYDCALPHAALAAMKPDGGINLGAVLGSLLTRPWQIPALMRTARDANAAFATLLRCRGLLGPRLGFPDLG